MATAAPTRTVLIVEDDPQLRMLYGVALEKAGFRCSFAGDGEIAFQQAKKTRFDLVIMDLDMPHWGGLDAIQFIHMVQPTQRVLVVSGYVSPEARKELATMPSVIGTMEKPVDIDDLLACINKTLK